MSRDKSKEEHMYTSTGVKFWLHPEQMQSYREGTGRTVISTHISPTSKCNLNCSYCSVKKRDRQYEIEYPLIQEYITDLKSRGLKAVIFTGGGEPTIYPQFNEMVLWAKQQDLDVALITNGTLAERVEDETWKTFSWVRTSINQFRGWQERINIPSEKVSKDCIIGASFVYTGQTLPELMEVEKLAKRIGAKYVRILPDCLHNQQELLRRHEEIDEKLEQIGSPLFFHQFKVHGKPRASCCHQSFFRPYLSEVDGGTVYPCDSLVLNNSGENFDRKYQICRAENILDFLDEKIKPNFEPEKDCEGCVFTENVEMFERWKKTGVQTEINIDPKLIKHANFP